MQEIALLILVALVLMPPLPMPDGVGRGQDEVDEVNLVYLERDSAQRRVTVSVG